MKAIFKDQVIADSSDTLIIEKDHYFPVESVRMEFLKKHAEVAACENEGDACYYDLEVNGSVLKDGASSYSRPMEASEHLKDYIVFGEGVQVTE